MPQLENLVLPGNLLAHVDSKSIPSTVRQLHIGRDMIKDLNGTLRELSELQWLFINANELTTLEGQLPKHGEKLKMIHASHNRIDRLPDDFKTLINLESLFFQHNLVSRLDGALSKSKKLQRAQFEHNRLNMVMPILVFFPESIYYLFCYSYTKMTSRKQRGWNRCYSETIN